MLLVVSFFFISSIFSVFKIDEKKLNFIVFIYIGIVMFLYAGLHTEGPDHDNYIKMFKNNSFREVSFRYITYALHSFSANQNMFFILISFITVFFSCFYIMRNTCLPWLALAVFTSNYYILHDLIQIRIAVSAVILLFVLIYRSNGNNNAAFFLWLFSVSFHYSAAIGIIIFIFNTKKINQNVYAALLLLCYILAIRGIGFASLFSYLPFPQISGTIKAYTAMSKNAADLDINLFGKQLLQVMAAIFMLANSRRLKKKTEYYILFIKVYCAGLIFFCLFTDIPVFSYRVKEYFLITEVALLPLIYKCFKKTTGIIIVILIASVILFVNLFRNKLVV